MKKNITTFRCDGPTCSNEITAEGEFPYAEGWLYLYKFNGKLPSGARQIKSMVDPTKLISLPNVKIYDAQDKHFCSGKCELSFISTLLLTTASPESDKSDKNYDPCARKEVEHDVRNAPEVS